MKIPDILSKILTSLFLFAIFQLISSQASAQENENKVNRDSVIAAAKEIISGQTYCGLITIDSSGLPNVRTMNPYPVEDDMTVWMATKRDSRKVKEILNNPNVCVYFADHKNASGYAAINGTAEIIDDKETLLKKKREYWEQSSPDWKDELVLIRIVPAKLELINYKYKLFGDPETWKSPFIKFPEQ